MRENKTVTAALGRASMDKPWSLLLEVHMRLGTKTALLSAAIGALTVSAVGSAHAEDLPPGHNQESRPSHAGESHHGHSDDPLHVKKHHLKKYFSRVEETSQPAPVAVVPVPADALCSQSVTTSGGDATTGDAAATGGAATTTATQTQTCNITVNLPPVGSGDSNQIRTETRTQSFIEEDHTEIRR
ncbi:hypothetical protein [Streptomyces sp. NPDC012510]|uniref:hypothetical protein n=1 Tax=Streptomyces sp. NPDC012510 TaxID=3364838 RepID=UPI0036E5CF9F